MMQPQHYNDYGIQPKHYYATQMLLQKKDLMITKKAQRNIERRSSNLSNCSRSSQRKGLKLSKYLQPSHNPSTNKQNFFQINSENTGQINNKKGRNILQNKILQQNPNHINFKIQNNNDKCHNKQNKITLSSKNSSRILVSSNQMEKAINNKKLNHKHSLSSHEPKRFLHLNNAERQRFHETQIFHNNFQKIKMKTIQSEYFSGSIIDILKLPSTKNNF